MWIWHRMICFNIFVTEYTGGARMGSQFDTATQFFKQKIDLLCIEFVSVYLTLLVP